MGTFRLAVRVPKPRWCSADTPGDVVFCPSEEESHADIGSVVDEILCSSDAGGQAPPSPNVCSRLSQSDDASQRARRSQRRNVRSCARENERIRFTSLPDRRDEFGLPASVLHAALEGRFDAREIHQMQAHAAQLEEPAVGFEDGDGHF